MRAGLRGPATDAGAELEPGTSGDSTGAQYNRSDGTRVAGRDGSDDGDRADGGRRPTDRGTNPGRDAAFLGERGRG